MAVLLRRYKGNNGMMQEERIDDDDRIERYMRLFEKDEEIQGKSNNAKAFILVSDGQAWSGEVAKSMALAQAAGIPVHVVGVGTTAGGIIPDPKRDATQAAIRSVLDRSSLHPGGGGPVPPYPIVTGWPRAG